MGELTTVVLGFAITGVVTAVCITWAVVHTLRVRNRVSPSQRTPAPIAWLWSTSTAARLHRRLRRTVLGTRACLQARAAWPTLGDLAAEIEGRAVALDRELVAAARLPQPGRRRMLAGLRDEVREVEALDQRLVTMAGRRRPDLVAVRERLDALDAALRELTPPPTATA